MSIKRAFQIEELDRKLLGISFQDLLLGVSTDNYHSPEIPIDSMADKSEDALTLYKKAINAEEDQDFIEAIYLYRKIIDMFSIEKDKKNIILLKSMNNLGAICYDLNRKEEAIKWFERILVFEPENDLAKENLQIIKSEK